MPPGAGLQKRATFFTLNVGLAGTGNQTQATCLAAFLDAQPSTTSNNVMADSSTTLEWVFADIELRFKSFVSF
jgi:hypothetical protein